MQQILKYPRTHHLESSRLQPGDEDLKAVPFSALADRYLVVEEKMDGSNSGISFAEDGSLRLQSRGHYLSGGPRERHFSLFKQWANVYRDQLYACLGSRYLMYGEWLYAKHTIFYNDLPHYFLEFDVYDQVEGRFLTTAQRRAFLQDLPFVTSVRVLHEGKVEGLEQLVGMVTHSGAITGNSRAFLRQSCQELDLDASRVEQETDLSEQMEGLYIKVEEEGRVIQRLKWVRPSFLTRVIESNSHWMNRPIVPNQIRPGISIFPKP